MAREAPEPTSSPSVADSLRSDERPVPALLRERTFVETLSLGNWAALFASVGLSLEGTSYDEVRARLASKVPRALVDALSFIRTQARDQGEHFVGLLEAAGIDLSMVGLGDPAPDVLAQCWLRSHDDSRLGDLVAAAQLTASVREGTRASHRYVGKADRTLVWTSHTRDTLQSWLATSFEKSRMTSHVRLDVERVDDQVTIYVLRGGRKQRVLRLHDESGESTPDDLRVTQCDLLYLDLGAGRLVVLPSEGVLAPRYAQAVGEALQGDATFFEPEGSFQLSALLRAGKSATGIEGRPDVQVSLERVEWEPKPGARMTLKADDCFGLLEQELQHPGSQQVLLARLVFRFARNRRRVGVTLRSTNVIKCSDDSATEEIESLLRRMGVLGDSQDMFWAFATEARPTLRWRRALRSRFEAAVASGLLIEAMLESAPHAAHSAADGAVQPLEGFDEVGVGVDDDVPPRRLHPDDLRGYKLHLPALAASLRATLRLDVTSGPPLPDGLLELGRRKFSLSTVRVFLAIAPLAPGLAAAEAMRSCARGERAVLLAPPEHPGTPSIEVVPLRDWLTPFGSLVEDFFDRLSLRDEMSWQERAGNARLVVLPEGVLLDGKKLVLTDQQVKLVRLLIQHDGRCSTKDLDEALREAGEGKTAAGGITRKVKEKLAEEIERVLAQEPRSRETQAKDILKQGRGYRFLVPTCDLTA